MIATKGSDLRMTLRLTTRLTAILIRKLLIAMRPIQSVEQRHSSSCDTSRSGFSSPLSALCTANRQSRRLGHHSAADARVRVA